MVKQTQQKGKMEMVINILLMLGAFGGGIALEMWRKRRIGQKDAEMSGNGEQMEMLLEIYEMLSENLKALDREKKRKASHAETMRRSRLKAKGIVTSRVTSQQTTEKEREGKEDIPPTPPIEEREEKEKEHTHTPRACAREIPSIEEIAAECQRIGSDIDPEYFHDFYESSKDGWPKKWKTKLRNWTKNPIESGRIKEETVTVERKKVDLDAVERETREAVLRHLQEEEAAHKKQEANHGN